MDKTHRIGLRLIVGVVLFFAFYRYIALFPLNLVVWILVRTGIDVFLMQIYPLSGLMQSSIGWLILNYLLIFTIGFVWDLRTLKVGFFVGLSELLDKKYRMTSYALYYVVFHIVMMILFYGLYALSLSGSSWF